MGVGLFVGVWIARYLAPEQFGLLSFATAFVGLFGAIAALGLQGIVVRDIVRNPDCARETLGTSAVLMSCGGLIAYFLMLIAITYLRPDDPVTRTIVAALGSIILFEASKVAVFWFESQVQSKYTVWVQNSVFLCFAALKVMLILQEASLITFVWATLAEGILVAIILLVVMSKRGVPLVRLRISVVRAKLLLKDSWPFALSTISVLVYVKIDQVMLALFASTQEVGLYAAAAQLSEVWYFVPSILAATLFPALVNKANQNEILYEQDLQRLLRLMVLISFPAVVTISFVSVYIVEFAYGEEYSGSSQILTVHIWSAIFVYLGIASNSWFLVHDLPILKLQRSVAGAVSNILLNLLLIPGYGGLGAAIATLISYAIADFFYDFVQPQTRKLFTFKLKAVLWRP